MAAIMAMFSKEMSISLPIMICVYEFCFFENKRKTNFRYLIAFMGIIAIIPITMFITKSVDFGETRRAAEGPVGISMWHYLLTQFRVLVTYIRLVFMPINQTLDYDYPVIKSIFQITVILSFSFLILILLTAFRLARKYRLISFGIFWFFITLLPESSIIPIKDVIFEHRLYLPMAGFSIFMVSGLYHLFQQKRIKLTVTILSILVFCYSFMAHEKNKVWIDEFTLWTDAIHKSPNKARPYNNQGLAYYNKGEFDQALSDYNKAIEIDPELAEAHNNIGLLYQAKGEFDQAIHYFSKAIEIDPYYANAYNNRGVAYHKNGEFDQALSDYNKAIAIDPKTVGAQNNRGVLYQIIYRNK